ncbi:NAD(P)-dependent oxidoreductase [Paracoccus sp. MC1854]|uniref:NAD-dependent epimerase/dehydratase family protein n=1 Tax=Paracoccus sp. MC1854 TaxID=2760306 RepID=UPI0016011ABB|nr:NAD(P)-dependent oxidoreductase [Paracoccus sp. MC1854]MBB1490246.1 NAD(P)-dependent oxidoreductase [Paracoccus sp. MC1854]
MRIALTGASGLVGRFLSRALQTDGHQVETLPGWRLGQPAPLEGCEVLIHAGFAHVPGKYRGGEGDDPEGFVALNRDGSLRLFQQAKAAGVGQVVFLSSRAVYDALPAGTPLPDGTPSAPQSLYGRVKAEAEAGLAALDAPGFATASLRATGIYGPGEGHKWTGLFADYIAGRPITPRIATELHGDDLSAAILLILRSGARGAFNASDLLLDRHDLLAEAQRLTGCPYPPPPCADAVVSVMSCDRLAAMGWQPGGWPRLRDSLPAMLPSDGS